MSHDDPTSNGVANRSTDGGAPSESASRDIRSLAAGSGWEDLVELLREGQWIILAAVTVATLVAALYSSSLPPEYQSTSVVTIETKSAVQNQRPEIFQRMTSNRSLMNELASLRLSYELALRVAGRLRSLAKQRGREIPIAWSNTEPATPLERAGTFFAGWFDAAPPDTAEHSLLEAKPIADRLLDRVSFSAIDENLDLIRITGSSTSPEEAHQITRLYVEEYEEHSQEMSRSNITSSRNFLQEQYTKAQKELQQAEANLQSYMVENRAVALDQGAGSAVKQISELDAMRDQTQIQLELERAALDSLQRRIKEIRPRLSQRVASGVDSRLTALQEAKADLVMQKEEMLVVNPSLQQEGNTTPRLRKINEQIASLDRQIEQLSKQFVEEVTGVGGVGGESEGRGLGYYTELRRKAAERRITISGLEAKLENIEQRIAERENQLDEIPAQMMRLAELRRQKQSAERVFTMLQKQLQETKIAAETRPDYVDVLREAEVASLPVRPHHARNLTFGILAGLLLGIALAGGRRMLDYSIKGPQDLRERGHHVLGVIPTLHTGGGWMSRQAANGEVSEELVMIHEARSAEAEAYRGLRMAIRFLPGKKQVTSLLVSSPGAGQGKSITSANLAAALAQSGHATLLVDADLRRPRQHEIFRRGRQPGLTDLLEGDREGTIHHLEEIDRDLSLLTAGTVVSSPTELLESNRMRKLVDRLEERYDYVIFDTPPLLAVTEAAMLSTMTDAVAVIVDEKENDYRALRHAIDTLGDVGSEVDGVVLNRFEPKAAYGYDRYYYGYSSEYHDYYAPSTRE